MLVLVWSLCSHICVSPYHKLIPEPPPTFDNRDLIEETVITEYISVDLMTTAQTNGFTCNHSNPFFSVISKWQHDIFRFFICSRFFYCWKWVPKPCGSIFRMVFTIIPCCSSFCEHISLYDIFIPTAPMESINLSSKMHNNKSTN